MSPSAQPPSAASPFLPAEPCGWPGRSRLTVLLAAALVVACSVPLFVGLDRQDIENDEAIYTYAVQRMVETGDWLTPRYVATDGLFLEKPPLKLWLAAAPRRLGLIPNTIAGIRLIDAALGAVAFAYIMTLGWRLGGLICGAAALVLLLAYHPLLFNHGLRENNMESALVLSYAAGLFHLVSWTTTSAAVSRRRHAVGVALWFVLGFMTKFVAALFLPLVSLAALLAAPTGWTLLTRHWRDWILPAAVSGVLITPWFVYQMVAHPDDFWATIFGAHVYMRFTTFVDPAHVQPWHFYVTDTWSRLATDAVGHRRLHAWDAARVLVAAGLVYALWRLHGPRRGIAALLLLWWALPIALMSIGTSKVTHYAYPFLPAVALAAGWICAEACCAFERIGTARLSTWRAGLGWPAADAGSLWRSLLLVIAAACVVLGVATFISGPVTFGVGDVRVFRNSSVIRPVVAAAVLLFWIGYTRAAVRLTTATVLVLMLPIESAARTVERALTVHHPLRASRECLSNLTEARPDLRRGIYRSDPLDPQLAVHQLFYSLHTIGAWVEGMERFDEEVSRRLKDPQAQTPMLLSTSQWDAVRTSATESVDDTPAGLQVVPGVILVLPGPYRACADAVETAGGRIVGGDQTE